MNDQFTQDSRPYTLADAIKQIDFIISQLPVTEGEEITNVSYCPQTKTLTVKSITHKIIQL